MGFIETYFNKRENFGPLCLGLDPSKALLTSWGLRADYSGLKQFCDIMLDAADNNVGIIKPQAAFFELYGFEGFKALTEVIEAAHQLGLSVIVDAKRGDIGSTADAYGKAWLGRDSAFQADSLTVNAFLGFDALLPLLNHSRYTDCGVFVVVQSSNIEGAHVQDAMINGNSISVNLAKQITHYNSQCQRYEGIGPIGAVVGATLGGKSAETIKNLPHSLFLVPGIGHQGGKLEDLPEQFSSQPLSHVIPSISRAATAAGPDVEQLRHVILSFAKQAQRTLSVGS